MIATLQDDCVGLLCRGVVNYIYMCMHAITFSSKVDFNMFVINCIAYNKSLNTNYSPKLV